MDESGRPSPDVSPEMFPVAEVSAEAVVPVVALADSGESAWLEYLRRITLGEHAALGSLYDDTNRLVYGSAMRILRDQADAEEVTLDVYMQIWRNASSFDRQRGSVIAWLMTLTRSRAIDRLRSGNVRSRYEQPVEGVDQIASAAPQPVFGLERAVQIALNSLAPEQREAIQLAYYSGYSHSELAERLGEPLGTVKTRIRLGMMKLRSLLALPSRTASDAT